MSFYNEYVPKPEAETSEYFRAARDRLRLGFAVNDQWTVDRDRDLVLVRTGNGAPEAPNNEYFTFLQGERKYRFRTTVLESSRGLIPQRLRIVRQLQFMGASDLARPTPEVIELLREALTVYKDYGVISHYQSCDLVLKNWKGEVL